MNSHINSPGVKSDIFSENSETVSEILNNSSGSKNNSQGVSPAFSPTKQASKVGGQFSMTFFEEVKEKVEKNSVPQKKKGCGRCCVIL